MEQYINRHLQSGEYIGRSSCGGCECFENSAGWQDFAVDNGLIFSHRVNKYTRDNFTEGLHCHDYYELLLYVGGQVEYINGNTRLTPYPVSAIWFLPGQIHTARLVAPSAYDRYVLYFQPEFFTYNGRIVPMLGFAGSGENTAMRILEPSEVSLLQRTEAQLRSDNPCGGLLAKTYITEFFAGLMPSDVTPALSSEPLYGDIAEVKRYIDENYSSIESTEGLAEHFFYSREHLSRSFRSAFNISLSGYLTRRRIYESMRLLGTASVTETCYAVGFGNQTSFISAFRKINGCTPSDYRRRLLRKN